MEYFEIAVTTIVALVTGAIFGTALISLISFGWRIQFSTAEMTQRYIKRSIWRSLAADTRESVYSATWEATDAAVRQAVNEEMKSRRTKK